MWQGRTRAGPVSSVRVTRADGRRRSLPGLASSALHPDPDFDAKVAQVIKWWERALRAAAGRAASFAAARSVRRRRCDANARCFGLDEREVASVRVAADPLAESTIVVRRTVEDTYQTLWFGSLPPAFGRLREGDLVVVTTAADGVTATELSYAGASAATTDSPHSVVGEHLADLVMFALAMPLFGAWCVAGRRSGRYPWWAPFSLPALITVSVIANHYEKDPAPLTAMRYVVAAGLLVGGVGGGVALSRVLAARADRRSP